MSGDTRRAFVVVNVITAGPCERVHLSSCLPQERDVGCFIVLPKLLACEAFLAGCNCGQDERVLGEDCLRHLDESLLFEIKVRDGDSECEYQVGLAVLCGSPVVTEASVPAFEDEVGESLKRFRRLKSDNL